MRSALNVEIIVHITSLQLWVALGYLSCTAAAIVYALTVGAAPLNVLLCATPMALSGLVSFYLWARYRHHDAPLKISDKGIMRLFYSVVIYGIAWGYGLMMLGYYSDTEGIFLMLLLATGLSAASTSFLSRLPSAAIAFTIICVTPTALLLAMQGRLEAISVAFVYPVFLLMLVIAIHSGYRTFHDNLALRVENDQLLLRAEAANEAKSEFIASVSHELRTPLNAIFGFAQLMEMADESEITADYVHSAAGQIMRSGDYLLSLVEDILNLTTLDSNALILEREVLSPVELFDELYDLMSVAALKAELTFEVERSAPQSSRICVDRKRFKQVLVNFLSNAVKYNRPGGSIKLACERLPEGGVRTSVHDTGLGINSEEQHKVFERFGRAKQSLGAVEGTGIGLYYAKRLTSLMGGQIGFHSTEGKGSHFYVDFPCA